MTVNLDIVPAFLPLYQEAYNSKIRYFFQWGGRGGAKSIQMGDCLLNLGLKHRERILCAREVQKSIKDSVHSLLKDRIEELGLNKVYEVFNTEIRSLNKTLFLFSGVSSVTEQQIKSYYKINRMWFEEAQAASVDSLRILLPTIREPNSKLYFTYNRTAPLDPVHHLFNSFRTKKEKMRYTLPNGKKFHWYLHRSSEAIGIEIQHDGNPFFPKVLEQERKHDKKNLDHQEYMHIWEGMPRPQPKDAILSVSAVMAAMERKPDDVGQWSIGVDVARNGKDGVEIAVKRGHTVKEIREFRNSDSSQIMRIHDTGMRVLAALPFDDKSIPIIVDDTGLGGGLTDWLIERGYHAIGVNFQQQAKDNNRYVNAISEMWFNFASLVDKLSLPYDNILLEDLTNRSEGLRDTRGRRRVESKDKFKERFGRSPDKADALLLACYHSVVKKAGEAVATLNYNIF